VPLVVHINGWPGCGKLTIARLLAKRLSARLIDNHLLLNPVAAMFDRGAPLREAFRLELRTLAFAYAEQIDAQTDLIFTDALAREAFEQARFDEVRELALKRRARCFSVVLDCDIDENIRRLTSPGRAELHKLTNADVIRSLRKQHQLLKPEGCDVLLLDVTRLCAEQAAEAIHLWLCQSSA
jgi:gluconate kinase